MSMNVQIIGVKELAKKFEKMSDNQKVAVSNAIHQAGFFLQSEVKASIAGQRAEPRSVDTGHFLQSVETDNLAPLESVVKSDVEYAKFLEYGTSKMEQRRHFRNSADRNKFKIKEFVAQAIK